MEKLILASASPRRIELLKQMGLTFTTAPQDADETFTGKSAAEEAVIIAARKVDSYIRSSSFSSEQWILGADTFVVLGDRFIGKPVNRAGAEEMLQSLQGQTHTVITGLALKAPSKEIQTEICETEVTFSPMSEAEIDWYLDQNEWQGVAASYRIQEKGACFIASVKGSYSNVMGLPINTFYGMLIANNFNFHP